MWHFSDNAGRLWSIQLGLATCRRIAEQTEGRVDFIEQARTGNGKDLFRVLADDLQLLGQVAWLLCERQARAGHMTEDEFADGFDLDVLERFQTALIRATIDFFPSRSRPVLQRALEIAERVGNAETERIQAQAMDVVNSPEFAATIQQAMTHGTAGSVSGNGPASLDCDHGTCGPLSPS